MITPNSLTIRLCRLFRFFLCFLAVGVSTAAHSQEHSAFEFKPAQTGLTTIFLQMAGSLEHYGHPGPYLRHIKSEHERIEKKYEAKHGKKLNSYCQAYMTEEYIDELCKNWDKFAPKLQLERLARDSGRSMRLAIKGKDGNGTSLILLFNHYQDLMYQEMSETGGRKIGAEQLKEEFIRLATKGETLILAEQETKLTVDERKQFRLLIQKPKFMKADFAILETFYDGPYDKLSEYGKSQISARVHAGTNGTDVSPTDARFFAKGFWDEFEKLFKWTKENFSEQGATGFNQWLLGLDNELLRGAVSEFRIGNMERAINRKN